MNDTEDRAYLRTLHGDAVDKLTDRQCQLIANWRRRLSGLCNPFQHWPELPPIDHATEESPLQGRRDRSPRDLHGNYAAITRDIAQG